MNASLSPWPQLRQAADKARLASLHEQAIHLYTQALEQPAIPWEAVAAISLTSWTTFITTQASKFKALGRVEPGWFAALTARWRVSGHPWDGRILPGR